jgi:hypothetical protein
MNNDYSQNYYGYGSYYDPNNNTNQQQSPTEVPNIDKFMREFNDKNRENFNDYWFQRNDDDLIEGMKKIILSCQRDKYFVLKVLDFEVIKNYRDINKTLDDYYAGKSKNNKRSDMGPDMINLRDSDIMLLKVNYYIKLNIPENKIRLDTKSGKPEQTEGVITVLVELPRYVDKYYFRILGNYYSPTSQIVDGSTYNNSTSNSKSLTITLKTQFMPIKVYKEYYELVDIVDKSAKRCVLFASYVFTKKTDAIKFILGRYGYYGALEFLELEGIYVQDANVGEPLDPNLFYNFTDKYDKIILSVYKRLFDKDNVTQSFCYTVLKTAKKLENFSDIFDPRYWNRMLGADFQSATLDKGIPVLDSFESIYDLSTKELIRLPKEDKEDSYCILRWMMRQFNNLKARDNLDISTKRARKADEYLPAIYAKKLSTGIYRISDKGKNITFKDVTRVIDIAPDYILKQINSANLVDYVDLVNDNDAELATSYTYKGISGLGDQGSGTAVPIIYRSVHPSHLGRVDLDSSSASDPGLSGVICPMAKVYDGSFSDFEEPNNWRDFYNSTIAELKDMYHITEACSFKDKIGLSYDYVKEDMVKETIETYQRLIPALLDIDGKIDYTKNAVFIPNQETLLSKSYSNNSEVGDIVANVEDNVEDSSSDL